MLIWFLVGVATVWEDDLRFWSIAGESYQTAGLWFLKWDAEKLWTGIGKTIQSWSFFSRIFLCSTYLVLFWVLLHIVSVLFIHFILCGSIALSNPIQFNPIKLSKHSWSKSHLHFSPQRKSDGCSLRSASRMFTYFHLCFLSSSSPVRLKDPPVYLSNVNPSACAVRCLTLLQTERIKQGVEGGM